ncbi:hypothetical protein GCM10009789_00010 [Kribbella sancticallisti]|uniref:Uncharacterized protein n=1 Tax=Kribbella sancticallisti TaxID=460087 RepID=A0ABP4MUS3_9ACTN
MDPATIAIVTSSALKLVDLMTTDVWDQVKKGFGRLLGQSTGQESPVTDDLDSARSELLAAAGDDYESTRNELVA